MADKKISELQNITGANLADGDELVVVDASESETKAITFGEFKTALDTSTGFVRITGDTMTGDLILNADPSVALGAATKQYVDTEITGLVDSAPAALDTLNELAAALGDDANFSTTVTNSIAAKVSKSGDTMTGDLDIQGTLTSDGLRVEAGTDKVVLANNFATTGNTDSPKLAFYSFGDVSTYPVTGPSIQKINTSSYGAGRLAFFQHPPFDYTTEREAMSIAFNGDISFYEDTGTTAKFFWDASAESLGIGTSSPVRDLQIGDNTGSAAVLSLQTTTTGNGSIYFGDNAATSAEYAGVLRYSHTDNSMQLWTSSSERMRIDSSGNVGIGVTPEAWNSNNTALQIGSAGSLFASTNNSFVGLAANAYFDATNSRYEYINADFATLYQQLDGAHIWSTAGSGTADTAITFSEAMRIDSSGNVGINTSSAVPLDANAQLLAIHGDAVGAERAQIKLTTTTSGQAAGDGFYIAVDDSAAYISQRENQPLVFSTNATEAMRIDSSGNLLVGKTSAGIGNTGFEFNPSGYMFATRSGGYTANFNRQTSDGDIVVFNKDGSAVGSIGSAPSNRFYIGNSDAGLRFLGDSNLITPWNPSTNSNSDNLLDLGNSANRWKDVYVGGGVYLGGTGSANHLDDYEEGTWTPVMKDGSVGAVITLDYAYGFYTKIGRLVYVNGYVNRSDSTAYGSTLLLTNLPFSSGSNTGNLSVMGSAWTDYASATDQTSFIYMGQGSSQITFKEVNTSNYWTSNQFENGRPIYYSFQYWTNS